MIDYLKLLLAILFPTLIGFVFVSLIIKKNQEVTILEKLALAFLAGCGILSLTMFFLGAFKINLSLANILIASAIILATPLYVCLKNNYLSFSVKSPATFSWPERLLFGLILLRIAFVLFENLIKPVVSVDAFANWSLRAKVFFIEGGLQLNRQHGLFLGGGNIFYPLNIPLMQTWIFRVLGWWNDELVKIIFGLFFICLLIIFYSAVKRFASRFMALLATYLLTTFPLLIHHASIEYADLPLTIYFTVSAFFLLNFFQTKEKHNLYLSALLAGIAAWTKNEGFFLLLLNIIILGFYTVRVKSATKDIFGYLALALAFKIPWSLFNFVYHVEKNEYQQIHFDQILANAYRIPVIANQFYQKLFFYGHWNIAWFVFIIVLVFSLKRLKELRLFFSLAYICLFLAMIVLMYYLTENYTWLLDGTTLNRNILIIMPMVMYFIAAQLHSFYDQ